MKKKYKNKFTAYQNIIGVLNKNSDVYGDHPVALSSVEEFRDLVEQIKVIGEKIDFDYSKLTAMKKQVKHDLAEIVSAIAAAIAIYAEEIKNPDLQAASSKTYTDIRRSADFATLEQSRALQTLALKHSEQLAGYMVSEADLAELKRLIDAFDAIYMKKEESFSESVMDNKRMEGLFKKVDTVLLKKIDRVVKKLKPVNKDFHDSYFQARVIVDL
ncbi:MAG: hypothetical protein JXR52_01960 [Bacteroidales bacterium]|nr:hypothetical protein [Bacteroidales bacterium]MBN2697565.1 hypothetical protein [Bacteroidales bacterium]